MSGEPRDRALWERECRALTRHLCGLEPSDLIVAKYAAFHDARADDPAWVRPRGLDALLVRLAARGGFRARLADAYAARVAPRGLLRQKLVLVLALLECDGHTAPALDLVSGGGAPVTFLRLFGLGFGHALWALAAFAVLGPAHLVLRLFGSRA